MREAGDDQEERRGTTVVWGGAGLADGHAPAQRLFTTGWERESERAMERAQYAKELRRQEMCWWSA